MIKRRDFLALASACVLKAAEPITRPAVSQAACPLKRATPVAADGHSGLALVRTPPGHGLFPAAIVIHGGLVSWPEQQLKEYVLNSPVPSRFLAGGYVVATVDYRSRDDDPQSKVSLEDCLAAVKYVKQIPSVDPKSVVVYGCSGGGDLALEIAATTEVCAIVPEEPASMLLTGVYNTGISKKGARYTPLDSAPIEADPKRYYTPEFQKLTRATLARIQCPILIIQGDKQLVNHFNAEVLIPELRAERKKLQVLTYPGEPHCFCFYGAGPRTPRPGTALKAYDDIAAFCRSHVRTKAKALDSSIVELVPATVG